MCGTINVDNLYFMLCCTDFGGSSHRFSAKSVFRWKPKSKNNGLVTVDSLDGRFHYGCAGFI